MAGKRQLGCGAKPHRPIRDLHPMELGWLAGFLEVKGWFGNVRRLSRDGLRTYLYPRVTANQVQRAPIDRMIELVGGYMTVKRKSLANPRARDQWSWNAECEKARQIMVLVRPLMSPWRQMQIDKAMGQNSVATAAFVAEVK